MAEDRKKQAQGKHGDREMPNRYLPLYKDFKKQYYTIPRPMEESAHPGLLFDKFCDHWSGHNKWKEQIDARRKQDIKESSDPTWDANPKTWFLKSVANHHNQHTITPELLKSYHERRDALITALNGKSFSFKTSWRFVSGLGMGHVLETGFVWHRILGVPYLPGSSVKGLVRAWAEHWGGSTVDGEVTVLFGPRLTPGEDGQAKAGSLIIFDAIPLSKPKLEVDIMNPHYGEYYQKKNPPVPPADYLSPNPIFFLTVAPDTTFNFALASRNKDMKAGKEETARGFELLTEALNNIGAGGKTAVGYGYMEKA